MTFYFCQHFVFTRNTTKPNSFHLFYGTELNGGKKEFSCITRLSRKLEINFLQNFNLAKKRKIELNSRALINRSEFVLLIRKCTHQKKVQSNIN